MRPFRFLGVLFVLLIYVLHMALLRPIVRGRWRRVRLSNRILTRYCRLGLRILGVKVNPVGLERLAGIGNALYVGNHLSYLDVLVISSQKPAAFVTSVEIRETPGLGLICELSGCLFVERRNRSRLMSEVSELAEGLNHGLNVAIFPEATSTNGESVLRFRRPLFLAAVQTKVPVVPFCLNYRMVGGQPINKESRDSVFWYGDMDFLPHLWALAGAGGVSVDLEFLEPMSVTGHEEPGDLAARSHKAVEQVFRPV